MRWDVFISHAREDKELVARPLAQELKRRGFKVWYDEYTLKIGDKLRRSIENGLATSNFGIVILSPSFFAKEWPQRELDGLAARESQGSKVLLPVWHNITQEEVAMHSPMLSDRLAADTSWRMSTVVKQILAVIGKSADSLPQSKRIKAAHTNEGLLELNLVDVRGKPIYDPSTALEVTDFRKLVYRKGATPFRQRYKIPLPAFPKTSSLQCEVKPLLYRHRRSSMFTIKAGWSTPIQLMLFRNPSKWHARFIRWNQLPKETFEPLKRLLARSSLLKIPGMQKPGLFVEDKYDSVKNIGPILAKANLLNLFVKLSTLIAPTTNSNWFSFIEHLVVVGRERLIAVVNPEMADVVLKIRKNISSTEGYSQAHIQNHFSNIPPRFELKKSAMFGITTSPEEGNVHLIVGSGKDTNGKALLLLDVSIDENGRLWAHLADLFGTKWTGSCHPFDIHEYLTLTYPDSALGYDLVH